MAEQDKLGTTDEQAGDAAQADDQGGAAADQGGLAAEDQARLNLSLKVSAEEARREAAEAKAELAEMRARQQLPAAGRDDLDPKARRRAEVRAWAEKNDPVAAEVLSMREEIREEVANELLRQEHERQLERIADEAKREKVRKLFESGRHLYGSPDVARERVEREELAAENERLRKQLEGRQAKKEQELKDVPATHARGEPKEPKTETEKMTFAEFDTLVVKLRAEGREREIMELQGRARGGTLELTY